MKQRNCSLFSYPLKCFGTYTLYFSLFIRNSNSILATYTHQGESVMSRWRRKVVSIFIALFTILAFYVFPVLAGPTIITEARRSVSPNDICVNQEATVTVELTGQADALPGGKNIVLVIDQSGSMASESRLVLAQQAAKGFIDQMNAAEDSVAVVSFSDAATVQIGLTQDFQAAKNAIDALTTINQTNMNDAVNQAAALLAGVSNGAVVLLSDGDWNDGGDPVPSAKAAKSNGITFFTIGLGSDVLAPNSLGRNALIGIAGTSATDQSGSGADYYFGQAQVPQQLRQDRYGYQTIRNDDLRKRVNQSLRQF
ncbi:MAG: VWA domain-containing protein [Caldilineaceae bacterium]|nr:VWA domain-containing protein [Caldilineaceae bacterium]